ncbi:MAG: DNA-binding protein [Candidatus Thermoplasmatota archaeon]|nr:DNA-binding protein [Candidatus Thermoplasmatota archaeon]
MNKHIVFLLAISGISLAAAALAQPMGWSDPQSQYNRTYNPYTVETLRGEITGIDTFVPADGWSAGVHIVLKTAEESIEVHLGPEWYVDNQNFDLSVGDIIEVTGSRVVYEGSEVIIAQQIREGDDALILRYTNGFPYWSGWRRSARR